MDNYLDIIFGAFLGFGLSLLLQLINDMTLRRRASKLLKLEYPEISKTLTGLVNSAEKVKVISSTEIPNFQLVTQSDYLLRLKKNIRSDVYSVHKQLEQAERLRALCYPMIGNPNKLTELSAYRMLYFSCLKEAKNQLDKLNDKL